MFDSDFHDMCAHLLAQFLISDPIFCESTACLLQVVVDMEEGSFLPSLRLTVFYKLRYDMITGSIEKTNKLLYFSVIQLIRTMLWNESTKQKLLLSSFFFFDK